MKKINLHTFMNILIQKSLPINSERKIIGICGGPGSGKSTLAKYSVAKLNKQFEDVIFAYLPMDGFHMPNEKLLQMGLQSRKGAIETFEIKSYLNVLKSIKAGELVLAPDFDHVNDKVIVNNIIINSHKIIITEGNYLLSKYSLWKDLSLYIDFCFFLYEDKEVAKSRLYLRQKAKYFNHEQANKHVNFIDMPNYDYVSSLSQYADLIVHLGHISQLAEQKFG